MANIPVAMLPSVAAFSSSKPPAIRVVVWAVISQHAWRWFPALGLHGCSFIERPQPIG